MGADFSKVSDNARLKQFYTGDIYIESRYCNYSPFNNVLLVAPREFVEEISPTLRNTISLNYFGGDVRDVPVWFRPCEYEDSLLSFHPDNGSSLFTYIRGVDRDILKDGNNVYISSAVAWMMRGRTVIIKPAIPKVSSKSLGP